MIDTPTFVNTIDTGTNSGDCQGKIILLACDGAKSKFFRDTLPESHRRLRQSCHYLFHPFLPCRRGNPPAASSG